MITRNAFTVRYITDRSLARRSRLFFNMYIHSIRYHVVAMREVIYVCTVYTHCSARAMKNSSCCNEIFIEHGKRIGSIVLFFALQTV